MSKSLNKILTKLEGKDIKEMYSFLKNQMALDNDNVKKIINLKTGIDITTFEDLDFRPHPIGNGIWSKGKVRGRKYSVVSGDMFYSDGEGLNYEAFTEYMDEPDGFLSEDEVTYRLIELIY
jgi:hypothetical protein